ncbi:formyltransferase family protein [Arenicella xantha]|uniref:Methionyl-tRNA formyltransferase n=1 Tax=Arenicella xantha TaxID=644221 RepID=A0A395JLP6_9GAMM|nr:formyltransferase family protein [Arenicella xantha]RBP49888.1 methionyl-tRNA formyltransferase [Arenicella xantha]
MNVTILCSSAEHPVMPYLVDFARSNLATHSVSIITNIEDLSEGDILFLVSCSEVVPCAVREKYSAAIVLHASALPEGRGWSPHVWALLEGRDTLTVSAINAEDIVDTGDIWAQEEVVIPRTALYDEVNSIIFTTEIKLMQFVLDNMDHIEPAPQADSGTSSYYRRRTPADSELNPNDTLEANFDLLRVCDPVRYPAFFRLRGKVYKLSLERMEEINND